MKIFPIVILALSGSLACESRLTNQRAVQLVRRSSAFGDSRAPARPEFVRVTGLLTGSRGRTSDNREGDEVIIAFEYRWPSSPDILAAKVIARRVSGRWRIDESRTRVLVPTWPSLPRETIHGSAGS